MKKVPVSVQTRFEIDGIHAVIVRKVTKFGNSAKVACPKEYLDREVYLVIV